VKPYKARIALPLLSIALCACSGSPQKSTITEPLAAHLLYTDGAPVPGAPEPEVVQMKSVETIQRELHVTVGNSSGDYVLVCNVESNKNGEQNCLAPQPQRNYLLFRKNTKWLMKGATTPMGLDFMQDWSVTYNDKENIGLMPAKRMEKESFQMFWLSSWTAKDRPR
jgi:hypothetical protein